MRRTIIWTACFLFICLSPLVMAKSREAPNPFNLIVGKSAYEDAVKEAKSRNWQYQEYEKTHFKPIGIKDPARGKNTFIKTVPKRMEGIRSIFLFFGIDSTLDALMVVLDPKLSDVVVQELDNKYQLVEKSLKGEKLSAPYPYALWQKGNVYIELQKPSAYRVRLLYVEKAVYPNYREFLNKSYPRYQYKELRQGWMDEL